MLICHNNNNLSKGLLIGTVYCFMTSLANTACYLLFKFKQFKQSLSYTYFNYSSRSYFDHILASEGIYDNLISCAILPHSDDNLSDHLPVKVTLNVVCENVKAKSDTCNYNCMICIRSLKLIGLIQSTKLNI